MRNNREYRDYSSVSSYGYSEEKKEEPVNPIRKGVICNAALVNVRAEPSVMGKPIGTLTRGEEVKILETGPEYQRIEYRHGTAYVSSKYCKEV